MNKNEIKTRIASHFYERFMNLTVHQDEEQPETLAFEEWIWT